MWRKQNQNTGTEDESMDELNRALEVLEKSLNDIRLGIRSIMMKILKKSPRKTFLTEMTLIQNCLIIM